MTRSPTDDPLGTYRAKRDFKVTSEPEEGGVANDASRAFVVQKHWATRLHYDLRLELDGTMRSWAVPKGPSYDPADKRMAVQVEDHPIAYNQFEGVIPKGQYGAGDVIIWDEGTWTPVGDARAGLAEGHLKFDLDGYKLKGRWALVKMKNAEGSKPVWLLIKDRDSFAKRKNDFDVVEALPDSIVPLRSAKAAVKKPAGKAAVKKATASNAAVKKLTASNAAVKKSVAGKVAVKEATASKAVVKKAATSHGAVKKTKTRETVVKKAATGKATAGAAATGKSVAKKTATHGDDLPGKALKQLPETLAPQLATLVDQAPPNPTEWLYEIKFDGYRITARIDSDGIRLFTRNGHDWTHKLPHVVQALSALDMDLSWLDGEIVIMDKKGAPDFGALQNAFDSDQTADIIYFVFDAPIIAGRDMRQESLDVRRALVEQAVHALGSDVVRFSQAFDVPADQLVKSACQMGLEGVIAKRRDSIYVSRRSPTWVKLKCTRRQEFVIVGFTKPKGSRSGLGALLLAVHDDDGALRYVGNVGSGFNDTTLATVSRALKAMQTDEPALKVPADAARGATWVAPTAVAEVSFSDWTSAGRIRHGVFRGLRTDKPASAITKETPQNASTSAKSLGSSTSRKSSTSPRPPASIKSPASPRPSASTKSPTSSKAPTSSRYGKSSPAKPASAKPSTAPALGKLTHPERVIDDTTGLTKLDVVAFYADVAALLLPHLAGRPVSFLRAPQGVQGQTFFQKHLEHAMPGVKNLPKKLDPGHPSLVEVPTMGAILSAAQMNVVEFHTWNAVKTHISKPDRMTFDLDPGEGVPWAKVQQAAQLVRTMLDALSLDCLLKTSGGKGLHVVVPLRRHYDWDTVKAVSQAIVVHLAKTIPDIFVSKSGPKNRVGKVFVDYLRNGFGATTASAWSARARPGLGVSVPIGWDELPEITSGAQWNITTIADRLAIGNKPWKGAKAQSLSPAVTWMKEG